MCSCQAPSSRLNPGRGFIRGRRSKAATRATIDLLLISLIVVFDEVAADLLTLGGHAVPSMPGAKAKWLRSKLPADQQWAARGVTELIAIRNVLVHGKTGMDAVAIETLKEAGVAVLPALGDVIEPGVDDLFRYRRAVRTALNGIKQVPNK